jgi:hypothetical protein
MRFSAHYVIGCLALAGIMLSSETATAQSHPRPIAAITESAQTTGVCPPGYYWEAAGYVQHGKYRPAHCAIRW